LFTILVVDVFDKGKIYPVLNSINVQNNQSKPIAFTSLKSNLRLGEKVLKDFKSEYPYLCSRSFVKAKIKQNKKNPNFDLLIWRLDDLSRSYNHKLGWVRKPLGRLKIPYQYKELEDYVRRMAPLLSETKTGNCGEQSKVILYRALGEGANAHNVLMHVQKKLFGLIKINKIDGNHMFTILGLKDGAKINKPKTWGHEAVIVDGWTNTVMPAREAIPYFENFLGFGSEKVSSKFKLLDNIQAKDLA